MIMNYEYNIRTDLAIVNKNLKKRRGYNFNGISVKKFRDDNFNYTNILFNNIELKDNRYDLEHIITKELKCFLKKYQLEKSDTILVVGLGNKNIASDSLGVITVSNVLATGYLKELADNKINTIYTFTPGVMKDTGFMSYKSIKALVRELKINMVIIIDSLISDNVLYLNKLVQIGDAGITPGSGISNYQEEISLKTLKIPVIVIGVPTAIEAAAIIKEAMEVQDNKIKFNEGYDLVVAKKDIDIFVEQMGSVIGNSINLAFKN